MKYTAYTYLIKCPNGQLYYGSRYAVKRKSMNPHEDLWVDYFTSSEKIHQLIEEYGRDAFEVFVDKVLIRLIKLYHTKHYSSQRTMYRTRITG